MVKHAELTDAQKKAMYEGSYEHTKEHTKIYEANGVAADDTPIDRAWARAYDAGHNPGPAVGEAFMHTETEERQHFQYAWASRDTHEDNVNKTVIFTFGGHLKISESGL